MVFYSLQTQLKEVLGTNTQNIIEKVIYLLSRVRVSTTADLFWPTC